MIAATKKWIFLKISGALLIPLMVWFILNLIKIYDQDSTNLIAFFQIHFSNFYLVSLLLMLTFSQL